MESDTSISGVNFNVNKGSPHMNVNVVYNIYKQNEEKNHDAIKYDSKVEEIFKKYNKSEPLENDDVEKLFEYSQYIKDETISNQINEKLKEQLSLCSYAFKFWNLAEKNNNEKLINFGREFILSKFLAIFNAGYIKKSEVSQKQLQKILKSDDLKVSSEDFVFDVLENWYENNCEGIIECVASGDENEKFCSMIQNCVRFTYFSENFFLNHFCKVMENNCNSCKRIKKNVETWFFHPNKRSMMTIFNTNMRRYYDQVLIQINTNDQLEYDEVRKFDPQRGCWSLAWKITPDIKYSCGKINNNTFLLLGGHFTENETVTEKTWSYDLQNNPSKKININSMRQPRIFFEMAIIDQNILAFGGLDDSRNAMKSLEIWKPKVESCGGAENSGGSWEFGSTINDMHEERYHHTAITYGKKLYVFGGYKGNKYLKSYEIYDSETCNWHIHKYEEDIQCYDFFHIKSAVLDDIVYVYECFKDSSLYEHHVKFANLKENCQYSNEPLKWRQLPNNIPNPQECRYLVAHERKIIFFGSEQNYVYDPEQGKWKNFISQELIDNYNHIFSIPKTVLHT